jgi:aminoglycoside phosphotransferase (APT) family kinase protein
VRAVIRLTEATEFMQKHEVSKIWPSVTLTEELQALDTKDNPWLRDLAYQEAFEALQQILPHIETRLEFSNGDWQPGNFLAPRGEITGFLDFESALFQDPQMGFVKYPIYDMYPLARTNLVQTFLAARGFSEEEFHHRLALGCLKTLR